MNARREMGTGCRAAPCPAISLDAHCGLVPGRRGLVRQRRVAPDAEVILHPAFGRQAVVVPAHRVEDRLAPHPLEAGDEVGVGVGERAAHVQVPLTVGGGVSIE